MNAEDLKAIIDNDTAWAQHVAAMPHEARMAYMREIMTERLTKQLNEQIEMWLGRLDRAYDPFSIQSGVHRIFALKVRLQ